MDIHHSCTCRACGRVLKRHRGKRSHCSRNAACRHLVQVMRKARAESVSAGHGWQTAKRAQEMAEP
jgi:hypothetical protein